MRGLYQRDFPIEINALRKQQDKASTLLALLHHELSAENTVIPFSLSLPVSHIKASLAPFRWSFPAMSTAARVAPTFPDSIFRAYDIRGVVPKTLTAETAYWIGRAIAHRAWPRMSPMCRSAVTVACPARSWWSN